MTIYQGWTPTPTRPRTLADDERMVRDMVTLMKANVKSGWYESHPEQARLDRLELERRQRIFEQRTAAQL